MSRHGKLRQFIFECPEHGVTRFRTKTGKCLICDPVIPGRPAINADRQRARAANLPTYLDYCPTHIVTPHSVTYGKCLTCFTTAGRPRQSWKGGPPIDPTNARAVARRAGLTSYAGFCAVHGPTDFGVLRGLCLTCFSAAGRPRVMGGPGGSLQQADNPRATARRAGLTAFEGICPDHGKTPHSVRHGGCLTCLNAYGVPRKRPG